MSSDPQGNLQTRIHPFRSPTPSITVKSGRSRKGKILKAPRITKRRRRIRKELRGASYELARLLDRWKTAHINAGLNRMSRIEDSSLPKPSFPTKKSDSRVLRGCCGAQMIYGPGPSTRGESKGPSRGGLWPELDRIAFGCCRGQFGPRQTQSSPVERRVKMV